MKKIYYKNSGITLVGLVVTIVVLLILSSVATYSGIEAIKHSKYTKFTTELKIVQSYVNQWYEELNEGNATFNNEKIVAKFSGATNAVGDAQAEETLETIGITDEEQQENFYILDSSKLKKLGIDNITQTLLISIKDRKVVSYLGFNYNGENHYVLDDTNDVYNVEYHNANLATNLEISVISCTLNNITKKYVFTVEIDGKADYVEKGTIYYGLISEGNVSVWQNTSNTTFSVDTKGTYKMYYKDAAGNISNVVDYEIE